MDITSFIMQYTMQEILAIEEQDEQLQAIDKARKEISISSTLSPTITQQAFLYILIQTALISYQIAGSGPLRRKEVMQQIQTDFIDVVTELQATHTNDRWWYHVLTHSQYNKRLYNNKRKRIQRLNESYQHFCPQKQNYMYWYNNMEILHKQIATCMKSSPNSKTICFAIKIFGYGARKVYKIMKIFPHSVPIPLDSRLITIAQNNLPHTQHNTQEYVNLYASLAKKSDIPPLHLDSLIRIEYRKKHGKE